MKIITTILLLLIVGAASAQQTKTIRAGEHIEKMADHQRKAFNSNGAAAISFAVAAGFSFNAVPLAVAAGAVGVFYVIRGIVHKNKSILYAEKAGEILSDNNRY